MTLDQIITVNGKLHIDKLKDIIVNKNDFISMQSKILQALKPFKHILYKNEGLDNQEAEQKDYLIITTKCNGKVDISEAKTKFFYLNILDNREQHPSSVVKWGQDFDCDIQISSAFQNKVKSIVDMKLAAFGFKLLHRILICGEKLYKWKKISSPYCSICHVVHSIKHMLWECNLAVYVWSLVSNMDMEGISWQSIVLGTGNKHNDLVISQLAFIIYKAWILEINDKKVTNYKLFVYRELGDKRNLYKVLGYNIIADIFESVITLISL